MPAFAPISPAWPPALIAMWKSVFLASGIFATLLGVEMLIIDSATIMPLDGRGTPQHFSAPDWAPWTLLSVGAVTILHLCTAAKGHASLPPSRPSF